MILNLNKGKKMKVKCLYNTGKNLSSKFLDDGWSKRSEIELDENKEYQVYGICFFEKNICMYLLPDKYGKPFWYPDEFFEIIDNKLSSLWYFKKYKKNPKIYSDWIVWGYYEIVNDIDHSDNLMERESKDMQIFYKRKKEMDLEFPDDSIKEKATIVDYNWLMCPICIDAWENTSIFGMVECPKCKTIMHNPRYKKL
jgi:hypothetical protein